MDVIGEDLVDSVKIRLDENAKENFGGTYDGAILNEDCDYLYLSDIGITFLYKPY